MDFTREPIIETVITPKEGFKIVVRSSKSVGQEEYFVDALEVVSFGNALFFRSLEKPKAFLVPATDYEILEVREARIVLKNVGTDRAIKIGGGREAPVKAHREHAAEKHEVAAPAPEATAGSVAEGEGANAEAAEAPREGRGKRDRRRNYRRRRGREEEPRDATAATSEANPVDESLIGEDKEGKIILPPPEPGIEENSENIRAASHLLSSLLTPPPQLISETIERYKSNALFKGAFYERSEEDDDMMNVGEIQEESNVETPITELAWEFSTESEAPATSFTEEELPPVVQEEPSELPPENHRD